VWGGYLLLALFAYAFVTVRVNVLALLMMSLALLYIQPLDFEFPALSLHFAPVAIPQALISLIKGISILYLVLYIALALYRFAQVCLRFATPALLVTPLKLLMKARPYFEWSVFTYTLTHYFIDIRKASKATKEVTATLYDGFSKGCKEIFERPALFMRFCHHHESSLLMYLFSPRLSEFQKEAHVASYAADFTAHFPLYAKTLLTEQEQQDSFLIFTVMVIKKERDCFSYNPAIRLFVDAPSGIVLSEKIYNS
jgi:hypothetical protein